MAAGTIGTQAPVPGGYLSWWSKRCRSFGAGTMAVQVAAGAEIAVGLTGEIRQAAAEIPADTDIDRPLAGAGGMGETRGAGIVGMAVGAGSKG